MVMLESLEFTSSSSVTAGGLVVIFGIALWVLTRPALDIKTPDAFPDLPIPGLLNTYRYIFKTQEFLHQAKSLLNDQRKIMTFWMGPQRVYLVTGSKNVQSVLRNSGHLSSRELVLRVLPQLDSITAKDLQRFQNDKSGRSSIPLDDTPEEDRIWAGTHRIMVDHLSSTAATTTITDKFCEFLSARFETRERGKWETIQLWQFIREELVTAAITALAGTKLLEINPGFVDAMWAFDHAIYPLLFSVPKLLYEKGYRARDEFHEMGEKWLRYAFENYDFDGPDVEWEEVFGMRFTRVHAKFLKDRGFDERSRSGMALGTIWAENANSAPIIVWAMIEVIRDPILFAALRKEAKIAQEINPKTRKQTLNREKLVNLPLLASVYAESMRLHVSVNITRAVDSDMKLDGYDLKKGSLVQSPSMLGHLDDAHWRHPDHPAEEFWAERFIVYEEVKDAAGNVSTVPKFSTAGHTGHWFPYGGGISICAGRNFAKQEIMASVAMLVLNFDVESLEYVQLDGSKSDRGPRDDEWWCGTAAMPPDRDLKIRWKRI